MVFCHTLHQAEAVSELLQARTTGAADSALAGLEGGVGSAVRELRAQVIAQGGTRVFAARSIRSVENQQCVYCLSMFAVDPERLLLSKKIHPSNMRFTSREILRSACICVTVSYSSTQELCSRSLAQLCCADLHGSLPVFAESLVDGGHAVKPGKLCECSLYYQC